jgi:hypothetical protein
MSIQGCYDTFNCDIGRGSIISEEIFLEPFHSIIFDEAGSVYIKQDTVQKVVVESHPNLIALLSTSVRNGEWRIRFRQCVSRYDEFSVHISVLDLNSVVLNGSGTIETENTITSEDVYVALPGSGNIELEIDCNMVDAELEGSGNITLQGTTDREVLYLSGSGNIRAFGMVSNMSEVTISGSGNCEVFVEEELDVLISGSGSVTYLGNPPVVNTRITGSGTVRPAN